MKQHHGHDCNGAQSVNVGSVLGNTGVPPRRQCSGGRWVQAANFKKCVSGRFWAFYALTEHSRSRPHHCKGQVAIHGLQVFLRENLWNPTLNARQRGRARIPYRIAAQP